MSRRVLLLSAYDADSHRHWRERLCALFPDWEWRVLGLPARHFNWRIRGNSLQWALQQRPVLEERWDLLLATSMVDLSALRGLLPALARLPTVLYFHENQFDYPLGQDRAASLEARLVPLYAALCADRLVFNSDFNRRGFMSGALDLLRRLPDGLAADYEAALAESRVIPVPLDEGELPVPGQSRQGELLEVVWNHRWEYDKGPALLLAVARLIAAGDLPVRLRLLGQRFRSSPAAYREIQRQLSRWAEGRGLPAPETAYLDSRRDYFAVLAASHVALSTADHDFQGLAVQEACASGCTPLVPDHLAYPEYIPEAQRYPRLTSLELTARVIVERLMRLQECLSAGRPLPKVGMEGYYGTALRSSYARLFAELAAGPADPGPTGPRPAPAGGRK